MGFLRRFFGGGRRKQGRRRPGVMALHDLERVEEELRKVGRGSAAAARLLNRAGDLHLARDDRPAALRRYGEAIDSYLKSGEYDSAMAVCRKIIRVVPDVIRTRRTLAWLCIGKGFLEIAREQIDAYVTASQEAGLEELAVQQIRLMSQYVERPEFREFLAGKLEELGGDEAADAVRRGEASDSARSAGWDTVVFGALLTPEELRKAAEEGVDLQVPASERPKGSDIYLFDPDKD